jgi:hypothetical protein
VADNTINKYYKNNTVKENDPYGFGRFTKGNVQRGQQLSSADTDTAVLKPSNVARDNATFGIRANTSAPSAPVSGNLKKGIDVYKRSSRNTGGTVDRSISTKSISSSFGPSILRTSSSFAGTSKTSSKPGFLAGGNAIPKRAAVAYGANSLSAKKSPGPLSSGSGLLAGASSKPSGGGLLSASKIAAPGNLSGGSALMKKGISDYKAFDPAKPDKQDELTEDTGTFIKSGLETPKEPGTL